MYKNMQLHFLYIESNHSETQYYRTRFLNYLPEHSKQIFKRIKFRALVINNSPDIII